MAVIYFEPKKAKQAASALGDLSRELRRQQVQLDLLRVTMRHKISGREAIAARLRDASEQLGAERDAAKALKSCLEQAGTLYQKTEEANLGRVAVEAFTIITTESGVSYDRPSGEDLLSASKKDKDNYISQFEKENPELARQLEAFLDSGERNRLSKDDIRDIKYLAYNANEPFRSIFLSSLAQYSIGNGDLNGGAYYTPDGRTVNYTYNTFWERLFNLSDNDSFQEDPRGKYTTFFHECGHAIDDVSDVSQADGSDTENFQTYSPAMGKSVNLREAILYDVYHNPDNPHSMTSLANDIKSKGAPGTGSGGDVSKVVDALQSGDTSNLSGEDLILYRSVIREHQNTTGANAQYEAVSDVYGAVSRNELRTAYGHDTAYWERNDTMAGKELWAEYFSYNMSGSQENLDHLLEYFPEASKVMEQYAAALGA